MLAFFRRLIASRLERYAEHVEREHPGPYLPDTVGALWRSFATNLRVLAADVR